MGISVNGLLLEHVKRKVREGRTTTTSRLVAVSSD